jgi:hypothetical protein
VSPTNSARVIAPSGCGCYREGVASRVLVRFVVGAFLASTVAAGAAEPVRPGHRAPPPAATDEDELSEPDDELEQEPPDTEGPESEDDELNDGRQLPPHHRSARPTIPSLRPTDPTAPRPDQEEPGAPPDRQPARSGPAEPARAVQPLGQE